jgi:site-specific DNA recombinase
MDAEWTAVIADSGLLVTREDPRLRIISDELWQRVKARQSARAIGPIGTKVSKAGKPATSLLSGLLLSGLLLCADCGSRFIARNQRHYQCATRSYGGLSACSNDIRVQREPDALRAEEAKLREMLKARTRSPDIA